MVPLLISGLELVLTLDIASVSELVSDEKAKKCCEKYKAPVIDVESAADSSGKYKITDGISWRRYKCFYWCTYILQVLLCQVFWTLFDNFDFA